MVKKYFIVIIALFLTITSSVCFANKSVIGETSIGGIHIDSTYNEVVSIYGECDKNEPHYNVLYAHEQAPVFITCIWGDRLQVQFGEGLGEKRGLVTNVSLTNKYLANNGISTPKGVHVGMPFSKAKNIYGITSNADWFYVLSPDRNTAMQIAKSSISVNGLYVVGYIKLFKVDNERDKKDFERFLTADK